MIKINLNWLSQCQQHANKITISFWMMERMVSKKWGLQPNIVKIWYRTKVKKTLTYARPNMGHNLNKQQRNITQLSKQDSLNSGTSCSFRPDSNSPSSTVRSSLWHGLKITQNSNHTKHYKPSHGLCRNIKIWHKHLTETVDPGLG